MKKIFYPLIISFYTITGLFSQPTIQWQKSIGGTLNESGSRDNIKQTSDGGYIFTGISFSNDVDVTGHHGNTVQNDIWVAKLDSSGNLEWEKSLGGRLEEKASNIIQTTDGGYILSGSTRSYEGDVTGNHNTDTVFDAWIVKLESTGNIEWNKCYGGSLDDYANFIQQTYDGGYIFSGYTSSNDGDVSGIHTGINGTESDYWVVKLDRTGVIEWQKCLGGTRWDYSYCIRQTTDTGYIVTGQTLSYDGDVIGSNDHTYWNAWVVKINSTGTIQWQRSLGGSRGEGCTDVQQTNDGGYLLGCGSDSDDGHVTGNHLDSSLNFYYDFWILKVDAAGNIVWKKCYGGFRNDFFSTITLTSDGGFILSGSSNSEDGDLTGHYGNLNSMDCWVLKCNSTGNIEWQQNYGGTSEERITDFIQTYDSNYVFIGYTNSNDIDVSGHRGSLMTTDFWVVKLNSLSIGVNEIRQSLNSISIIPNPVSESATISFDLDATGMVSAVIYDNTGREIVKLLYETLFPGRHEITWNANDQNNRPVKNGLYVVTFCVEGKFYSRKINVIRNEK